METQARKSDSLVSRYCDPVKLAAELRIYQDNGTVTEDLGAILLRIAAGVWDRFRYGRDRDDFIGSCALHLLGTPLKRVNPAGNPFAFLSTCAIRFGNKHRRRECRQREREAAFLKDFADAYRASGLDTKSLDVDPDSEIQLESVSTGEPVWWDICTSSQFKNIRSARLSIFG